jgi:hypothetical protein
MAKARVGVKQRSLLALRHGLAPGPAPALATTG